MRKLILSTLAVALLLSGCNTIIPPGQVKKQFAPGQVKKVTGCHPVSGKCKF